MFNYVTTSDREREVRDYIIEMLDYENEMFEPKDISNWYVESNKFSNIFDRFKNNAALSGSISLYIFGLLNRKPNDVDYVVDEYTDFFKWYRYDYIESTQYPEEVSKIIAKIKINEIRVDIFKIDEVRYRVVNGLRVHEPLDVLKYKLKVYKSGFRDKDRDDFIEIFNKMKIIKNEGYKGIL